MTRKVRDHLVRLAYPGNPEDRRDRGYLEAKTQ